jgi:hypothetical protein
MLRPAHVGILCIAAILLAQSAAGQIFRERNRNSYIGLRAGYSVATWSGLAFDYPDLEYYTISGYHGGVFIAVHIADNFTIEPGVYYSAKGWQSKGIITDVSGTIEGTITNSISYIDAPIMFRIFLRGLNFGLGPQVSLPIKSNLDLEGTINGVPGSTSIENTQDLNDFDIAVALSIGYEFDFGLSLHATYDVGVTEAHATSPYPYEFPLWTESKNRVVKLSVAFVIY